MQIEKIETGFAIKFPFALKDEFRRAFPSAKWNPRERQWQVGPRSGKRLEKWVAECSESARRIEEAEKARSEADLTENEVKKLQKALREVEQEMGDTNMHTERAKSAKTELEAVKKMLNEARESAKEAAKLRKEEEEAAQQQKDEIDKILAEVMNMKAINEAVRIMYRSPSGRKGRERFEEAVAVIDEQRGYLAKAGFKLTALDELSHANPNRLHDRDGPRHLIPSDWYDLQKIENDDD